MMMLIIVFLPSHNTICAEFNPAESKLLDSAYQVVPLDMGNILLGQEKFPQVQGKISIFLLGTGFQDVAIDADDTLYLASSDQIWKIDNTKIARPLLRQSLNRENEPYLQCGLIDRIAISPNGRIYISANQTIHQVLEDGTTSLLAGKAYEDGQVDGRATDARFDYIYNLSVSSNEVIYVASAHSIRTVDLAGHVRTLAGSTESGYRDGQGDIAQFAVPEVHITDKQQCLVVDRDRGTLREVLPDNTVRTQSILLSLSSTPDTTGKKTEFKRWSAVAFGLEGSVFFAIKDTIFQWTPTTGVSEIILIGGWAEFAHVPQHLAVDSHGNIYVTLVELMF